MDALLSYIPALAILLIVTCGVLGWALFFRMPGGRYDGEMQELTAPERDAEQRLRRLVQKLAGEIGERNMQRAAKKLAITTAFLQDELRAAGLQSKLLPVEMDHRTVYNVEAVIPGSDPNLPPIIVGAHYDTVEFSPGADDNASAVAANLALAHLLVKQPVRRTIRLVFFVNEEMPYTMTKAMGSLTYAKSLAAEKTKIQGMICLESIGYFSDAPGSQRYPALLSFFFPKRGNFIAFVSNMRSRSFLWRLIGAFRHKTVFPSEGLALPEILRDLGRSDHYPFWRSGFPAVMITDTANFRNPHYHDSSDTPETLDYKRLARITAGLADALNYLANRD